MSDTLKKIELDPVSLASLLCNKLCHDVISPVGAIVNGLEILDDDDPETRVFAMDLIRKSAESASARVQFARIAFGAGGGAGTMIDLMDAEELIRNVIQDDRITIHWNVPRLMLPKDKVKLLLNMFMITLQGIVKGGEIFFTLENEAETTRMTIKARGENVRIPQHVQEWVAGKSEDGLLQVYGVQAYYTGLVAAAASMGVTISLEDGALILSAQTLS